MPFTGTPVWFQIPSATAPAFANGTQVSNPGPNVAPGPFVWKGKSFWITTDFPYNGSQNFGGITAYQSNDFAQTQPFIRIPSTFNAIDTVEPTCYWNGGRYVNLTWIDPVDQGTAHRKLLTALFDMELGAFGAVNDPGVLIAFAGGGPGQVFGIPTKNGNLTLIWDNTGTPQLFSVTFAAGTWGGVVTSAIMQQLLGAIPISGNLVGVLYGTLNVNPAPLGYATHDGTAFTVKATTTIANFIQGFLPWVTLYDSVHDIASIAVMDNNDNQGNAANLPIYTVTPSNGSGGAIVQTVVDTNPGQDLAWEEMWIVANPTFTQFFTLVNQGGPADADSQLFIYSAKSLLGPWSPKSVYYDQNQHNSVPPADITPPNFGPLITPFYVTIIPDGRIAVSLGLNTPDGSTTLLGAAIGPAPPTTINPGDGGRKIQILTPNQFDFCLHREYRLFCNIDYNALGCAKLPKCFTVDEREWGEAG